MARGEYRGVNGVSRKIVKEYRSVEGIARKVKTAYRGVDGVARQYFDSLKYRIELYFTSAGTATSTNMHMADEGDYLYIYVGRTANSDGDMEARSQVNFLLKGVKSGDIVSFTYTSLLGSYTGFYCYQIDGPTGGYMDEFDSVYNYTYAVTCQTDSDLIFRVDNGRRGISEAWVKIHNITVNGKQIYPYN